MRFNINLQFSKESWSLVGQRLKRILQTMPRWLLVKHGRDLSWVVVLLTLAVASFLLVKLLYFEPPGVAVTPPARLQLLTDAIDRLEFWIDQHEDERSRGWKLPKRVIFK